MTVVLSPHDALRERRPSVGRPMTTIGRARIRARVLQPRPTRATARQVRTQAPSGSSTTARGYGWTHQQERAKAAPVVAAGRAVCWRCRRPIAPGAPWDLGHHDLDRTRYMGPEHAACNRSAAAENKAKRRRTRAPAKALEFFNTA